MKVSWSEGEEKWVDRRRAHTTLPPPPSSLVQPNNTNPLTPLAPTPLERQPPTETSDLSLLHFQALIEPSPSQPLHLSATARRTPLEPTLPPPPPKAPSAVLVAERRNPHLLSHQFKRRMRRLPGRIGRWEEGGERRRRRRKGRSSRGILLVFSSSTDLIAEPQKSTLWNLVSTVAHAAIHRGGAGESEFIGDDDGPPTPTGGEGKLERAMKKWYVENGESLGLRLSSSTRKKSKKN
ncbi:hypothetical protein BDY24DRAFT_387520 [Mrakia frigida]|uniref:uncharacterized protein n=1 Tax=Mrakia frigida TaxID=29902 RepID=UPI003FCC2614